MTNCLITMKSVTYAMKAQRILTQAGITVTPVKLGNDYSQKGCTHGLRFECRQRNQVIRLLQEGGVPYSAVTAS